MRSLAQGARCSRGEVGLELGVELRAACALLATVLGQDLEECKSGVFAVARRVARDRRARVLWRIRGAHDLALIAAATNLARLATLGARARDRRVVRRGPPA